MNVGGRPDVECQLVLGLVGRWLCSATSVQYFAQEASPLACRTKDVSRRRGAAWIA